MLLEPVPGHELLRDQMRILVASECQFLNPIVAYVDLQDELGVVSFDEGGGDAAIGRLRVVPAEVPHPAQVLISLPLLLLLLPALVEPAYLLLVAPHSRRYTSVPALVVLVDFGRKCAELKLLLLLLERVVGILLLRQNIVQFIDNLLNFLRRRSDRDPAIAEQLTILQLPGQIVVLLQLPLVQEVVVVSFEVDGGLAVFGLAVDVFAQLVVLVLGCGLVVLVAL